MRERREMRDGVIYGIGRFLREHILICDSSSQNKNIKRHFFSLKNHRIIIIMIFSTIIIHNLEGSCFASSSPSSQAVTGRSLREGGDSWMAPSCREPDESETARRLADFHTQTGERRRRVERENKDQDTSFS